VARASSHVAGSSSHVAPANFPGATAGIRSSAVAAPTRSDDPRSRVVRSRETQTTAEKGRPSAGRAEVAGVFAGYLLLSLLIWWQVWSTHPSSVTTCGCGDTALFLWFIEWPAYAIAHAHNPLYSSALFHPAGINLLSNTSVLAIGIILAPVTWLFGPVATLNVASTLAPALSAAAMFWLLRRWVSSTPGAVVGGAIFGFSPFALVSLAGAHLMTGVLVLVPMIVACLDELVVRQRRSAPLVGLLLGVLVAAEFFVSTEVLVIVAVCIGAGVLVLGAYAAMFDRHVLLQRAPHAAVGLGTGVLCGSVLLAYPLWFALDGPAHLSGLVWPNLGVGAGSARISNMFGLHYMSAAFAHQMTVWGGYQGPRLPMPEYLGPGAVVVTALALALFRHDTKLWYFAGLGILFLVVSLGLTVPWTALGKVPVIQNVFPGRFQIATTFCLGVVAALAIDHTESWVRSRLHDGYRQPLHAHATDGPVHTRPRRWRASVGATAAGLAVGAVVVVPMAGAVATNTPITAGPVALPRWFAETGPHVPPAQVVLTYPAPFSVIESAMAWQAVDGLRYAMAGGGGPGGIPARAGKERAGLEVLNRSSVSFTGPPPLTSRNVGAVRSALQGWGVTMIVVPDPSGLPLYDRGSDVGSAVRLFTAVTGRPPHFHDDAWTWTYP
jgi:hypothetical protein